MNRPGLVPKAHCGVQQPLEISNSAKLLFVLGLCGGICISTWMYTKQTKEEFARRENLTIEQVEKEIADGNISIKYIGSYTFIIMLAKGLAAGAVVGGLAAIVWAVAWDSRKKSGDTTEEDIYARFHRKPPPTREEKDLAAAICDDDGLRVGQLIDDAGIDPSAPLGAFGPDPLAFATFQKDVVKFPPVFPGDRQELLYSIQIRCNALRAILERHANPNAQNSIGKSPLILSTECYNLAAIEVLLEFDADPNVGDNNGITALMWAVIYGGRDARDLHEKLTVLDCLIQGGADINAQNNNGTTAMMYACDGRLDMMRQLVKYSPDLTLADNDGRTVADEVKAYCIPHEKEEMIEILAKAYPGEFA